MCMAVSLPPTEVARRHAQLGRQLYLWDIAALNYPDPGRWTGIFSLPLLPVYRTPEQGGATMAFWPFLPPHVKSKDEARQWCDKTGNCRAEEMFDKPTWKAAAQERRCLVPVLGYYDHQHRVKPTRKEPVKVPYLVRHATEEIIWVGALWQQWHDGPVVTLCTIEANAVTRWVHNSRPRQLLIVPPTAFEIWLAGGGPDTIASLLVPRDDDGIVAEETAGSTGKWVEKAPPPPENCPPGISAAGEQISLEFS